MPTVVGILTFMSRINKNAHFNIYEQDKFQAQLSYVLKKFCLNLQNCQLSIGDIRYMIERGVLYNSEI